MLRSRCSVVCDSLVRRRCGWRQLLSCGTALPSAGHRLHYHSDDGVYGYRPAALVDHKDAATSGACWHARARHSAVWRLIDAYRQHGHKMADYNPLLSSDNKQQQQQIVVPELELSLYGLSESDMVATDGLLHCRPPGGDTCSVAQLQHYLRTVFCGHLSAQFCHLSTMEEREWLAAAMERAAAARLTDAEREAVARLLLHSQTLDRFLAVKFGTVKRYGGEGAESALAFFSTLFRWAAHNHVNEVVIGMAHRGRLNLLACLLNHPPVQLMQKMRGLSEFPAGGPCSGDVLSHIGESCRLEYDNGTRSVHVTLLSNPSHLEAVNPMLMGYVRARQQSIGEGDYYNAEVANDDRAAVIGSQTLPVQVHGDAAVSGQGVIQECLTLSRLAHTRLGGSLHLVLNNQLGYTAPGHRTRSSRHCSDVAAMVHAPVVRVNGDQPESVVKACRLAAEYRRRFARDVFVDLVCYRRRGHNELDDPTITNPAMYRSISSLVTVPDRYAGELAADGLMTAEQAEQQQQLFYSQLNQQLKLVETHCPVVHQIPGDHCCVRPVTDSLTGSLTGSLTDSLTGSLTGSLTDWDTGVEAALLQFIALQSVAAPPNFVVHDTLSRSFVQPRVARINDDKPLDWATCEAMAFGSLLLQGYHVRLCGQDVGRGTFSHRHAMLVDQLTEHVHVPLNHLTTSQQAFVEVVNSALSEEAQLAYEYGVSIESARRLCVWEAQFGDFFNGAQIAVDTMISSGQAKWNYASGLVLLLPHGLDGAGPEHSSCRLERFLQLTDSQETSVDSDAVNMHVINPTTPAQYFHALRRQMARHFRRPLIVAAPKTLLRAPHCVSSLRQMAPGTRFQPVIDDDQVDARAVRRLIFCSGRHYYNLIDRRRELSGQQLSGQQVAVVRVEQLAPFPVQQLMAVRARYPSATDFVWSQEEHENQGAWSFVRPRFRQLVATQLRYCGRPVSAVPATGTGLIHSAEAARVIQQSFQ